MNLSYQHAIISFRHDLTDPASTAVPIASLVTASALGRLFVVMAVDQRLPSSIDLDPFTTRILQRMPDSLHRQVDELVLRRGAVPKPAELLEELALAMRNTIHVSYVSVTATATVEQSMDAIHMQLADVAIRSLNNQQRPKTKPKVAPLDVLSERFSNEVRQYLWEFAAPRQVASSVR